jgi:hypothetical protein
MHVNTVTGLWAVALYEAVSTPYLPGCAIVVGANIKLLFTPSTGLASSADIRLLQFKDPIAGATWAVDRDGQPRYPYFNWNDEGTPQALVDVGNMDSLAGEALAAGRGSVVQGERSEPAFLVDTPRESVPALPLGAQRGATFTTFAYDLVNGVWLGGVSWGYTLTMRNVPSLVISDLHLRKRGAPPGAHPATPGTLPIDEARAALAWDHARVPGRVRIANW